jgi:excisionase family DNA binding protein
MVVETSERLSYTFEQAVAATGLSRSTLERQILAGQLVARKVGRRVLITRASLESFLRRDHHVPTQDELQILREKKQDKPSPRAAAKRRARGAR